MPAMRSAIPSTRRGCSCAARSKSLGADCIAKEMRPEHLELLQDLLERAGVTDVKPEEFKRYGSARTLYNFNIDNADAY